MPDRAKEHVTIPVGDVRLEGSLAVPDGATAIVVFAHGSGSSRHSPRNAAVAANLQERGLGTLLFDLLTEEEDRDRTARFDVSLLTDRLVGATEWLAARERTSGLAVGYFGSSTGAAAALRAAAIPGLDVGAVVSRGGRVDLASDVLDRVSVPTRLIVGGADTQVVALNRDAYDRLPGEKDLHVVEGAGHLFEGPGELEAVAEAAGEWFEGHLRGEGTELPGPGTETP